MVPRNPPVPQRYRARYVALGVLLALVLSARAPASAQSERFFKPTEGFVRVEDLPEDFAATVRSIQLEIRDAIEGSPALSEAAAGVFEIGNKLHIESRPGTIRRRLLFKEGDVATKGLLIETQKALRSERFLADAILEARKWEDGSAHVIVTTYDQWTTNFGFTPQVSGGEFYYQLGVVESNLLGTGQRLGLFVTHARERDMFLVDYANNALTPRRLRLSASLGWLTDGYSTQLALSKPLESRSSRHAFSVSWSAAELSEYVYFDANQLDLLPDSVAAAIEGVGAFQLYKFDKVATHEVSASVTRSFGRRTKFNVSPTVDWKDRYNHGDILSRRALIADLPPQSSAAFPEERFDVLAGVAFSLYQYDYKTVHNFRNLKWSETLETGWRLSTKISWNLEGLGARNGDFYQSHTAVYNDAWRNAAFLNLSASLKYFVSPGGDFDNGQAGFAGEFQWKPHPSFSSLLSAAYANYFAAEQSYQFVLGEENGLNGYPNAYYAGQSRVLFEAEQRYFPGFEFLTIVPALAVFGNAGNTFPAYDEFDWDNLHYAVGAGLRLGFTKTVQKLVWHFNLSRPVGEERLDGWVFGFRVKLGL